MSWSPSYADAVPDPRLDAYRQRAAELRDGDVVAGYALVESDYRADLVGGALWWRRWGTPYEFAVLFTKIGDAEPRTTAVAPEDLGLFAQWDQHGYADGDRTLRVVWLDEAGSARVHDEVFAHQH